MINIYIDSLGKFETSRLTNKNRAFCFVSAPELGGVRCWPLWLHFTRPALSPLYTSLIYIINSLVKWDSVILTERLMIFVIAWIVESDFISVKLVHCWIESRCFHPPYSRVSHKTEIKIVFALNNFGILSSFIKRGKNYC